MKPLASSGNWIVKKLKSIPTKNEKKHKESHSKKELESENSKTQTDSRDVGRRSSTRSSKSEHRVSKRRNSHQDDEDDGKFDFENKTIADDSESDSEFGTLVDEKEELTSNGFGSSESETESGDGETIGRNSIVKLPEIDPVYDSASSDEEQLNTVGKIPLEWYKEFDHIGYDKDGNKIQRPAEFASENELDKFLSIMEDPRSWRSVKDALNGRNIELSTDQLSLIQRIQENKFPDENYDPYEPTVEWFTGKTEVSPLSAAPEPKRRFVPSKHEAKMIMKIARGIRKGYYSSSTDADTSGEPQLRDLWALGSDDETEERPLHISAPKMRLPGNAESYNPPKEYLFTPEEEKQWEETSQDKRSVSIIPKKYGSLRQVPAYDQFIQERFKRCLDLYLCPRAIKNRIQIDPNTLLPELPDPSELEPFPKYRMLEFIGHKGRVRCVSVDPTGNWLATGGEDGTLRVWEIASGRCMRVFRFGRQISDESEESKEAFSDSEVGPLGGNHDRVSSVAWHPSRGIHLLLVAVGQELQLICPRLCSLSIEEATNALFADAPAGAGDDKLAKWTPLPEQQRSMSIKLPHFATHVSWHGKGDYFASVASRSQTSTALLVHRISHRKSQAPFSKAQGLIQSALFHPKEPILFVATQRHVKKIDLKRLVPPQTLLAGVKWISSMDIHPSGNHLVVGSYDRRLCWFDLDLGLKPWKVLRYSSTAIRAVQFHPHHPLFASVSDSGELHLFHARVYSDGQQNPLIVPVKILQAHDRSSDYLGALDCFWHPREPWVFTCGVYGNVRMFCP